MRNIRIITQHWSKVNNVTLYRGKKIYDLYKHTSGATAKRYGITEELTITEKEYIKYKSWMKKRNLEAVGKTIKIIKCFAAGKQFENLLPGSKHTIISPPKNQKSDNAGVWVMGVGEPVKVLNSEFEYE